MIALVIVGILGALAVVVVVVAGFFVSRAVETTFEEGGGIPGFLGGECLQFQAAFMTLSFGSFIGPGATDAQLEEMESSLDELRGFAPDEIEGDLEVFANAFRESMQLALSGAAAGSDAEATRQAEEILESPEVVQAQENIDAWLLENCS